MIWNKFLENDFDLMFVVDLVGNDNGIYSDQII